MIEQITMGCDPEAFLFDRKTMKPVCAHGLIPGTKKEPFKVDKGAVQVDGCAVEFNIDPVSSEDQWVDHIQCVISQLKDMLPKDVILKFVPYVKFDKAYWDKLPEEAKILGCEPDVNAYTLEENVIFDADVLYRTAAGHIHIGWGKNIPINSLHHINACALVVRELDYWLSALSTPFELGPSYAKRRKLYGAAGAMRVKDYGVEYRTPSNFWLRSEKLMRHVYRTVEYTIDKLNKGRYDNQYDDNCYTVRKLLHSGYTWVNAGLLGGMLEEYRNHPYTKKNLPSYRRYRSVNEKLSI